MGNILIFLIPSGSRTWRAHSYLVDAGLGVQKEELDGGIVLQVGDAFYIESARETPCVRPRGQEKNCWVSEDCSSRAEWRRDKGAASLSAATFFEGAPFLHPCVQPNFWTYIQGHMYIWENIPAITKRLENANQKPNGKSTYTTLRF